MPERPLETLFSTLRHHTYFFSSGRGLEPFFLWRLMLCLRLQWESAGSAFIIFDWSALVVCKDPLGLERYVGNVTRRQTTDSRYSYHSAVTSIVE